MKTITYIINDNFGEPAYITIADPKTHTPRVYKLSSVTFDDYQVFLEEIGQNKDDNVEKC